MSFYDLLYMCKFLPSLSMLPRMLLKDCLHVFVDALNVLLYVFVDSLVDAAAHACVNASANDLNTS